MEEQEQHIRQCHKANQQERYKNLPDGEVPDCSWIQEKGLVAQNLNSVCHYVNRMAPIQSLTGTNSVLGSFTAASNVIKSYAAPAITATATLVPKLMGADHYLTGLATHSNAIASSFSCSNAMDILNSTGSANSHLNGVYSPTGLLASDRHLNSWYDPSIRLCNYAAKMYGDGSCTDHIYPKNHFYGTSFSPSSATINAAAHIKPLLYSGYTADQLLTHASLPTGLGSSITHATGGAKLYDHKFYGGGDWLADQLYPSSNSVEHFIPNKWYGGGEATPLNSNEIYRALDLEYDHYVVNQKRDTYKYLLDNYDDKSGVQLAKWSPIAAGTNWSDAFTGKISSFVDSLDLYIATKDYSLLHDIHHLEWEVMALSYSVGMGAYLEAFYDRINSRSSRNKYARRRLTAIINQKLKVKYKLDLRIIFRNIIRFLFKNMNDDSEDEYVELPKQNNIFQPFKLSQYENRESSFYFKHAA